MLMKIATIFLTVSLILMQNLFAVTLSVSAQPTSLADIIGQCDSGVLNHHEMSDGLFAEKLKQVKEHYKISIDKDWNRRDPIIDSLRQSFNGCLTVAQAAAYNVFMVSLFGDLPSWDRDLVVGEYCDLPVSQWKRAHIVGAITNKINNIFANQDLLRQLDATPYVDLFRSNPLNNFDNLYQLLLTTAISDCSDFDQNELRNSLIMELYEETAKNPSLQINTFVNDRNINKIDSLYLPMIEKLIAKFNHDASVVRLVSARLKFMFNNPSEESKVSASYYEQLLEDCYVAIGRFDDSYYVRVIKNVSVDILTKRGEITAPRQVYPDTPFTISISQQNYEYLDVVAYKVPDDIYAGLENIQRYMGGISSDNILKKRETIEKVFLPKSKMVFREVLKFNPLLYVSQAHKVELSVKEVGNYLVLCRNADNEIISVGLFCASRIAPLSIGHNGVFYLYATDFMSGKPIDSLEVDLYNGSREEVSYGTHVFRNRFHVDGFVKIVEKRDLVGSSCVARIIDGEDCYAPMVDGYLDYRWESTPLAVSIFTDRKRYMLGDSVCFRGYLYDPGENVVPYHNLRCNIRDPKWEIIKSLSKIVTTDEWGGFSGGFVVPNDWMAGSYAIRTTYGGVSIEVGDYKPPTVEIDVTTDRVDYSLGDSVKVEGIVNAYAGFPIADAKVNYMVTRSRNSFFRRSHELNKENVVVSELTTNTDGKFNFSFSLEPESGEENREYIFTITTSVTTPTGETQLHEEELSVGVNRYMLKINVPNIEANDGYFLFSGDAQMSINKDDADSVVVTAIDVYQDKRDGVEGRYKVLSGDREVLSGPFETGASVPIPWQRLKSGNYKLVFNVDRALEVSNNIFVYSMSERVVPVDTVLFCHVINPKFSEKRPLEFVLGSSKEEVYTLVELYDNQKKWYSKLYVTKNEMEKYTIPYNKEFPDDLKLIQTTFYKGELYRYSYGVERQVEKKEITLKLQSVREVALPGSRESLSFEVCDKKTGEGVEADVLVTIYDKSTDMPQVNVYDPLQNKFRFSIGGIHCTNSSSDLLYTYFITSVKKVELVGISNILGLVEEGATVTTDMEFCEYEEEETICCYMKMPHVMTRSTKATNSSIDSSIEVRDNFNQTALFATEIRTDSMGVAKVDYELPDAVTTYSIRAFATLKDATSAVASAEFIASKSVMIMSNLPQFFRVGDEVVVRANVVNITNKAIDAEARLELFDVNSKEIIERFESSVSLSPNSTEVVAWSLPAMETDRELIGMRFIVDSPNHSDAEERIVPVVPAEEPLIKGLSYFLSDEVPQVEVNLRDMLVDGASDEVIYVSSGVPSLMLLNTISNFDVESEPVSVLECADRLHIYGLGSELAYYYRSTISEMVAEMVKDGVSIPKHEDEQYGELLDVSRSETPWDKKMKFTNIDFLQTLRNKERCSSEVKRYTDEIGGAINPDGGFGWFKGMSSSFAVTAYILDRYIALSEAPQYRRKPVKADDRSVTYLDNYIVDRYNRCVADGGEPELDGSVAYYLYIRSRFPFAKMDDEARKVREYYLKLAKADQWKELSIMGKAYIALALEKMDVDKGQILAELSTYAVKNKTLGYYFPNAVLPMRGSIYSEVSAHSLLLKLYTRNKTYADLANGLAQWIMLQRKNQAWSANVATLDATWAVWDYYQSVGVTNQKSEMVVSSNAKLKTPMALGCMIDVAKVKKNSKAEMLTVKRKGSSPLFVDVVYSYKQPLKQIVKSDNGFDITRRLYRFVDGKYIEVDDQTVFNVGDQVLATYHIQNSENRSYVRVRALRGGALEPVDNTSGYKNDYYREVRKSHNNYYFYLMPEGSTTIDEHFTVWYSGRFNDGFVGIQSLYNPTSNGNTATYTMDVDRSMDIE